MKKILLPLALSSLCILTAALSDASAYEFKLLNGMVMKGALTSFADGVFHVKTEFGSVDIEADKLDYIIVEETDPGPSGFGDKAKPSGVGIKCPGAEPGKPAEPVAAADMAVPEPPMPLFSLSVPPAMEARSIDPAEAYPGLFRGNGK